MRDAIRPFSDPIKPMADAMEKVAKEEGIDLPIEFCALLAIVGLQAVEPNQSMLSAGGNCLESVSEDEAERQELAGQVFSDMILAAVQENIEPTHNGTTAEN